MALKQTKRGVPPSKADIVLHPIRFRILMIASGRKVSAQQLLTALPEVPQASLYRQIARLVEAGILLGVEEPNARGAPEKYYTLPEQAADLSREEMAAASAEDHLRYFTSFMALMMSQFRAYQQRKTLNGVGGGTYWTEAFYLSDAEYEHFVTALKSMEGLALSNDRRPDRRRRMLFAAIIPDAEEV